MVGRVLVASFAVVVLMAPAASAQVPRSRCTVTKLSGAARKVDSKLACYASAALRGTSVDAMCIGKAEQRFDDAFDRAENAPPCFVFGDAGAVETTIDAAVGGIVTALDVSAPADLCASRKIREAGKKARRRLACQRRGAARGDEPDQSCLDRATTYFAQNYAQIEARLTCATTGDVGAIEAAVDALEASLVTAIRPVPASDCLKRKFREVAALAEDKLRCHADVTDDGLPVEPACLTDADADFAADWADAESLGDCLTLGDEAALAATADGFVSDTVATLRPAMTASECAERKLRDAAQIQDRVVRACYGNALGNGLPVDPDCVAKAGNNLDRKFANTEAHFLDCLTTGDSAVVQTRIETFASDVETALVP